MKVAIDHEYCAQCHLCVETAPDVFKAQPDGSVVAGPVPEGQEGKAEEAWDGCPMESITVEREVYPKPPLGVMPRTIHTEQRLVDVLEAVVRYVNFGKTPYLNWLRELADLGKSPHCRMETK